MAKSEPQSTQSSEVVDLGAERRSRGIASLKNLLSGEIDVWEADDEEVARTAAQVVQMSDAIRAALAAAGEGSERKSDLTYVPISLGSAVFIPSSAPLDLTRVGGLELDATHRLDLSTVGRPETVVTEEATSSGRSNTETVPETFGSVRVARPVVPTPEAWKTLRAGLLLGLGVMIAAVFGGFVDFAVGAVGLYIGFAIFCLTDFIASRRNNAPVLLPPTVARAGIWTFVALAITVVLAAS